MRTSTCDKCGENIDDVSGGGHLGYCFGYGTKYDGLRLDIDLCELCLIKLFKKYIS